MEENREPGNRITQIWSTDLQQRNKGNSMEKRQSFQQMLLDQVDTHMPKHVTCVKTQIVQLSQKLTKK